MEAGEAESTSFQVRVHVVPGSRPFRDSDTYRRRHKYDKAWRLVCTFSNATVASTLVAAVELTIKWNKIRGVNTVDTVVQMAPLLLSFMAVLRALFYTWEFSNKED